MQEDAWVKATLREVSLASVQEQRRARRWNIFFRFAFLGYLLFITATLMIPTCSKRAAGVVGEHTAIVDINGVIAEGEEADAERINEGMRRAFEAKGVQAVVLKINSPGGSPVQAGLIYDEIRRLRALHEDVPVYAVAGDLCASAAYYIASAADEIYVDKASMVGSIGVLLNSFGFTGTMERFGVERRLYTAGENKDFLDPFSPEEADQVAHVQSMLDDIHQQFIEAVKNGRGDRLADKPEIFSGLIWTGRQAKSLGLVDGLGSVGYVARELVGAEETVNYTPKQDLLTRLTERLGASIGSNLSERLVTPNLR